MDQMPSEAERIPVIAAFETDSSADASKSARSILVPPVPTTLITDLDLLLFTISYAIYFSPIAERRLIDNFLFNNDRRSLALLVVFHERFNKRAFLILVVAEILTTRLPLIL